MSKRLNISAINLHAILIGADNSAQKYFPWRFPQKNWRKPIGKIRKTRTIQATKKG